MRTVPSGCITALNAPRTVGARLTFRQRRLVFADYVLQDSLGISDPSTVDACTYSSGILRVVNFADTLYYQEVSDVTQLGPGTSWPNWVNSGIALKTGSTPSCDGGYIWLQIPNGDIYRYTYPGLVGTKISSTYAAYTCTLASIGNYSYLQFLDGGYLRLAYLNSTGTNTNWVGRIYGDIQTAKYLDAVSVNSVDYLYFMDRNAGHILEISKRSSAWSSIKEIVPIDPVDNTMGLTLGRVSVINSKAVVTGRLVRTSDGDPVSMDIYTMGPGRFTTGRDMYITAVNTGGKLFLIGDKVYYVGVNNVSVAPATILVGYDNASLKTVTSDLAAMTFSEGETRTGQISIDVASDLTSTPVAEGNECTLELSYNNNWAQITKFSVDQVANSGNDSGQGRAISGSTFSMKALANWFPDASIWMPSQAKVSAHPSALDKLIRARGTFKVSGGPLVMNELNTTGVLYSVGRAAKNGIMRCKFKYPSGDFAPRYGVGINYYQESKYDASVRLGIPQEKVTDDVCGDNGIVVVWGPTEKAGAAGVALYLWTNGALVSLATASLSIPADTWHWLQIQFQDGLVRVMYRLDSSTDWTAVLTHTYVNTTRLPWKRETFGRGVIYLENVTDRANGWGFYSDDTVVPVDALPFPEGVTSQVLNGSFETLGAGGADVFANWVEVKGHADDQLLAETTKVYSGSKAAKIIASGSGTGSYLYQDLTVTPAQDLIVNYVTQGDGSVGGILKVYDNTHGAWISATEPPETCISTTYERRRGRYTLPAGCTSVRVGLYAPTARGTCYFDSVNCFAFPASETVLVDSEQIVYVSKSPDYAATDQLVVIAPHYKPNAEVFRGYEVDLDTADGVHADGYYTDMALIVEEGTGTGRAFRIRDYDAIAPQLWIPTGTYTPPDRWQDHIGNLSYGYWADSNSRRVFVDRDPSGSIGEGAKVKIVKCLHVGYRDPATASTHGATLVSLYRDLSTQMDWFDSYSSDVDNCLEDAISEVVARADAGTVTFNRLLGSVVLSPGYVPVTVDNQCNFVTDYTISIADGDDIGIVFRLADDGSSGYRITISRSGSTYYLNFWTCTASVWTIKERVTIWVTVSGSLRFSVQEDAFSVWMNGYHLHTFRDGTYTDSGKAGYVSLLSKTPTVVFPELSDFIEDLIIDSRTSGLSVIEQMLDGRIVFYCGDASGGLRFYRNRTSLGALPDILVDYDIQKSDAIVSRLRLEGLKVVEVADFDKLRQYGNLFANANNKYADKIADFLRAAGATIEDIRTQATQYALIMLIHPAMQAGDCFTATFGGSARTVDVRGITMNLQVDETNLVFQATVEGTDHYVY